MTKECWWHHRLFISAYSFLL